MSQTLTQTIQDRYAAVARSTLSSNDAGVSAVAKAFGYSADELSSIPAEANMGLSCGNPTAAASLRPGEVVVDLGSGGGLDVFLAARKVGPTGKAIGIDMTPDMIERARRGAETLTDDAGQPLRNVEFHLAGIDRMPLPDASVDCVISNCVINLATDKPAVFREIYRVLKPGGRLAASDIALKKPLPAAIAKDVSAYVGCIAGAILVADYIAGLHEAGFAHVHVTDSGTDLNAYSKVEGQSACCSPPMDEADATKESAPSVSCCGGSEPKRSMTIATTSACCGGSSDAKPTSDSGKSMVHGPISDLLARHNINDYATSVKVYAVKK